MAKQDVKIKVGYEVGTGEVITVSPAHMIVTGLSQKAGKTTTLESLIKRSGKKAIVFRTKIGEKSFLQGTIIPPYFKDRSDWQFIQGLVEATIKEKLRSFERAKIIQISEQTGGNSLLDFKKQVDERLLNPKLNGFEKDILTNLRAYLEIVLPKLQSISFSNKLELVEGLNIMDLERFSRDSEVQSLIISSVLAEVLYNFKGVIVVLPEAWKFDPQDRGNPCKVIIEEFIRQGAANENFIWFDSQDMTGVDKTPLKQITEWGLGYQSEINEVKHTLDQIPLPKQQKPKAEDIMSLGTGVYYWVTRERTVKVYVQPFWLDDERARKVAIGEIKVSELDVPEKLASFAIAVRKDVPSQQPIIDLRETSKRFNNELSEMSTDFFNKIGDLQEQINKLYTEIYDMKIQPKQEIDEDVIVRKVLQKMPIPQAPKIIEASSTAKVDEEVIISKILSRIPASGGAVYTVSPLEKIKKDFLDEIKAKIIADINSLDDRQKKILKFVEVQNKRINVTFILEKCLLQTGSSGSRPEVIKDCNIITNLGLFRKDQNNSVYYPNIHCRIDALMGTYDATQEEKEQLYNHIMYEVIK